MPPAHTISVLRWEDEQRFAALLARAFVDDPLVIAICDATARERQERMQWSFRIAVRSHYLAGQPAWTACGADDTPVGVVLLTRSRTPVQARSDVMFTVRALRHIGLRTALRGFRAARVIGAYAPSEPFSYLRTLGVDPAHQRRGVGAQLVEQVLRASPAALPVYLETAKEQNLSFYTRLGFQCAGEFRCLGAPVWRLIRPAAADSATVPQ